MELKSYQQRVIADLTDYLGYLEECKDTRVAFKTYPDCYSSAVYGSTSSP